VRPGLRATSPSGHNTSQRDQAGRRTPRRPARHADVALTETLAFAGRSFAARRDPRGTQRSDAQINPFGIVGLILHHCPVGVHIEPYLRREWQMALTESDCSLGQLGGLGLPPTTAAIGYLGQYLLRSAWRRMRDSNSRGVAPNTLSNTAGRCSPGFATVRDLGGRQASDRW
jgi:hypothetical protein